jgi:hypothetical protein
MTILRVGTDIFVVERRLKYGAFEHDRLIVEFEYVIDEKSINKLFEPIEYCQTASLSR